MVRWAAWPVALRSRGRRRGPPWLARTGETGARAAAAAIAMLPAGAPDPCTTKVSPVDALLVVLTTVTRYCAFDATDNLMFDGTLSEKTADCPTLSDTPVPGGPEFVALLLPQAAIPPSARHTPSRVTRIARRCRMYRSPGKPMCGRDRRQ